jgi:hypothetical protein
MESGLCVCGVFDPALQFLVLQESTQQSAGSRVYEDMVHLSVTQQDQRQPLFTIKHYQMGCKVHLHRFQPLALLEIAFMEAGQYLAKKQHQLLGRWIHVRVKKFRPGKQKDAVNVFDGLYGRQTLADRCHLICPPDELPTPAGVRTKRRARYLTESRAASLCIWDSPAVNQTALQIGFIPRKLHPQGLRCLPVNPQVRPRTTTIASNKSTHRTPCSASRHRRTGELQRTQATGQAPEPRPSDDLAEMLAKAAPRSFGLTSCLKASWQRSRRDILPASLGEPYRRPPLP